MPLRSNSVARLASVLLATALAAAACGPAAKPQASELLWQQSRTNSQAYAYLDAADLQDKFIFGVNVTNVSGFLSNALNVSIEASVVSLRREGNTLQVVDKDGDSIFSFGLRNANGRMEIDFASARNDLSLRGRIDAYGGALTAGANDGFWYSEDAPTVLGVQQDRDTVVVDLQHTVRQVKIARDGDSASVTDVVTEQPGQVVLRLFLKRQSSVAKIGTAATRTVANGLERSLGFFPASVGNAEELDTTLPVQRFAVGNAEQAANHITFYLKDVPAKYAGAAREAILAWNKALGPDVIRVEIAPPGVDAGDPRYHVVKWFDGTDKDLMWAGVAKMLVEPTTGTVMSGTVYVQGSTLITSYEKMVAYTKTLAAGTIKRPAPGTLGTLTFSNAVEETPVAPFFTNPDQSFDEYMQGYYKETIGHEIGHVLGLRHNFRGSVVPDANGASASIMDYTPRSERSVFTGPGSYDLAALRWAYFGEEPATAPLFCTDEDIKKQWDCSQSDFGDPLDYTIKGLVDGAMLLSQRAVAIESNAWISSMESVAESALKMMRLKAQLPAARQADVTTRLADAYRYLFSVKPDASLSTADQAVVAANLERLRVMAREAEVTDAAAGAQ